MTEPLATILMWAAGITAITTALFALGKLLKPLVTRVMNLLQETETFVRDWSGEPAGPGRDAIPGVMERLNKMDGELSRNGGKSVKDTVNRIEKRLIEGDKKFDDLYARVEYLEKRKAS